MLRAPLGDLSRALRATREQSAGPPLPVTEWWAFESPRQILEAREPEEVPELLARVEAATRGAGDAPVAWAVGFVAYEAAPGLDPSLVTRPLPPGVPAARFALFDGPRPAPSPRSFFGLPREPLSLAPGSDPGLRWLRPPRPTVTDPVYRRRVEAIRDLIAAGDTYQVNLTYRLRGELAGREDVDRVDDDREEDDRVDDDNGEAARLFLHLGLDAPYGAYLELGPGSVCSASPELFFERLPTAAGAAEPGFLLRCRPMKGTAPRGARPPEDRRLARALAGSPKDRAENLMIVDMIRNDLGRVAAPGSVEVSNLFRIETYPTLFQMTSEVTARSEASLVELFRALFPCASVTGAPKVRTMERIAQLEATPRGVYTGAVGFVAPGGAARFSVAIRTAWVGEATPVATDRPASRAVEYGTGSGIVWDSAPQAELEETRTKTLVLTRPRSPRRLLETLRWEAGEEGGELILLERHLDRLGASARAFGLPWRAGEEARARAALVRATAELPPTPHRVRLLAGPEPDAFEIEAEPLTEGDTAARPFELLPPPSQAPGPDPAPWTVGLAPHPVDPDEPLLGHKTDDRRLYERAWEAWRAHHPEPPPEAVQEVLLWNLRGELTEGTFTSLVLRRDGDFLTPAMSCGLLPGTLRAELLERGLLREAILPVDALEEAEDLFLINSVRGWRRAQLWAPPQLRSTGAP